MNQQIKIYYQQALLQLAKEIIGSLNEQDILAGKVRVKSKEEMSMAVKLMQIADNEEELTISELSTLLNLSHATVSKIKRKKNDIMHLRSFLEFVNSILQFADLLIADENVPTEISKISKTEISQKIEPFFEALKK